MGREGNSIPRELTGHGNDILTDITWHTGYSIHRERIGHGNAIVTDRLPLAVAHQPAWTDSQSFRLHPSTKRRRDTGQGFHAVDVGIRRPYAVHQLRVERGVVSVSVGLCLVPQVRVDPTLLDINLG